MIGDLIDLVSIRKLYSQDSELLARYGRVRYGASRTALFSGRLPPDDRPVDILVRRASHVSRRQLDSHLRGAGRVSRLFAPLSSEISSEISLGPSNGLHFGRHLLDYRRICALLQEALPINLITMN